MCSFDHVFTLISYLQTLLLYLLFHFCFSPTCLESIRFSWRFNTIFQIIGSKVPFLGILTKLLGGLKIFRSVLSFIGPFTVVWSVSFRVLAQETFLMTFFSKLFHQSMRSFYLMVVTVRTKRIPPRDRS